jgi:hypothetical protein
VYFTSALFFALTRIDPFVFVAPICLGLGASFITLLAELEQTRRRWLRSKTNQPRGSSQTRAGLRRHPLDRQD